MHVMISCEILSSPEEPSLQVMFLSAFSGRIWAQPLPSCFVVSVSSQDDYETLVKKLKAVAKEHSDYVSFIVSPPMEGRYTGWLLSSKWPDIKAVAQGASQ